MQIKSAEFIKGITGTGSILNDPYPQVGFVGRSNVGKSSLINSLCNRKNLVKVSSQPGKTRQINFFFINQAYYFVDLPGYGFAHASQKEAEKLRQWIVWYITTDEVKNKKIALVVDIKVGLTDFDLQVVNLLQSSHTSSVIVANKCDTVRTSEENEYLKRIQNSFPPDYSAKIVLYSSKTNSGRDALTSLLLSQ